MITCVVFGCGKFTQSTETTERENISLYRIPADENLKMKWIKVIWGWYEAKKCESTD